MPIDATQDALDLFAQLLRKQIHDEHRCNEIINILRTSISKEGYVGGESLVKIIDPRDGTFITKNYKITVLDDLGYPSRGVNDIGGQCVKGEIVSKGHIFKCMECQSLICEKHLKFIDEATGKAVCSYNGDSCFKKYYKKIYQKNRELNLKNIELSKETEIHQSILRNTNARKEAEKSKIELENLVNSRPGWLDRLFGHPTPYKPIMCTYCDFSPNTHTITCAQCGYLFTLRSDSARICPHCDTIVREIKCYRCQKPIYL